MRPRMLLYSVAAFLGVVTLRVRYACCTGSIRHEEMLGPSINALYKTVNFMVIRPHQMNVDAVFGLTLVEAHVTRTLKNENIEYFDQRISDVLSEVLDLCQRARQRARAMIFTQTRESSILNRVLNNPELWLQPINWSLGLLGPRPSPSKNNSVDAVQSYFFKGTPNETESDWCISQLALNHGKRDCQVSDHCANMLLKNDKPRGYPLTHRLLYVEIAIALRCKEHESTPFGKLIPGYCTAILQDAVDMEDAGLPAMSRDMICEQVVLCGMNGYTEFANDHYARLIISWQNPEGCFSAYGFPQYNQLRRVKRESDGMDFGCDNHATSLGAASLSLLIRHFVETSARDRK